MTYEEGVTFLREILDDQNAKFRVPDLGLKACEHVF